MKFPKQLQEGKIILLLEGTKNPYATHKGDTWHIHNTTDKEVKKWKGNFGFICGSNNIRVIDIEGEKKNNPYFKELKEKLDKLNTFTISTPSGGRHYFITNKEKYSQAYWNLDIGNTHAGEYRAKDCYVATIPSKGQGWKYKIINNAPIKHATSNYITELMEIKKLKQTTNNTSEAINDETRSGKEFAEVIRLQKKSLWKNNTTLNFKEIDKEMQPFSKWTSAPHQYKELTYLKATEIAEKDFKEKNNDKKEVELQPLNFMSAKEVMKAKMPKKQIVDGMIQPKTVTSVIGMSDTFKSTFTQVMSVAVATGKQFIGRKCKKSKVAYLDKENAIFFIGDRIKKIHKGLSVRKNKNLSFLLGTGMFDDKDFVQQLIDYLKENEIALLCVDSMVRYHAGEENSARDINLIYQALVRIKEEAGTAVVLLHHCGKNGDYRGSSDIKGMVDCSYKIERKNNETSFIKVINEKNRTGKISDMNLEVLYTDKEILITENNTQEKKDNEKKGNSFVLTRGFILQYARSEWAGGRPEFKRASLSIEADAYNAEKETVYNNFEHGLYVQKRQISEVLKHLIKIGTLKKGEKQGYYVFENNNPEDIDKWIQRFKYLESDFVHKAQEAKKQESGLNAFK